MASPAMQRSFIIKRSKLDNLLVHLNRYKDHGEIEATHIFESGPYMFQVVIKHTCMYSWVFGDIEQEVEKLNAEV